MVPSTRDSSLPLDRPHRVLWKPVFEAQLLLSLLIFLDAVRSYRLYYLDELCAIHNNSHRIELGAGSSSAAVIYLTRHPNYSFRPLDCRLRVTVTSESKFQGIVAVVEEMDMRQFRDQANHRWASDYCVDYLEVHVLRVAPQELCGKWSVGIGSEFRAPPGSLVGYCPGTDHDRCEGSELSLRVVVSRNGSERWQRMQWGPHSGFTVVVTAYDHGTYGNCLENQHRCYSPPYNLHELTEPHCIWGDLRCDEHQNCGFLHHTDEFGCSGHGLTWSLSTSTILMGVWLAVISILLIVILLMLRWRRLLHVDGVLCARRRMAVSSTATRDADSYVDSLESSPGCLRSSSGSSHQNQSHYHHHHHHHHLQTAAPPPPPPPHPSPHLTPTISVTVLYQPIISNCNGASVTGRAFGSSPDAPPTYESLFPEDPPPNYNQLAFSGSDAEGRKPP